MNHSFQTLEFDKIKEKLKELCLTKRAKNMVDGLVPFLVEDEALHALKETTEARSLLDQMGMPPLVALDGIDKLLHIAEQGGCLTAEELERIGMMLTALKRLKDYLCKCKVMELGLPYYESNLDSLTDLREELAVKIRGSRVDDYASKLLKELRSGVERLDDKMRRKAEELLKNQKGYFSDSFVVNRNGHMCLPVKKEYKFKISGSVIDKSATGATLFIEPVAVAKMSQELMLLQLDAENEERRILYELTDMVAVESEIFRENARVMEKLDFLFAKGKLSAEMQGVLPKLNVERRILIKGGRHPFLEKDKCVPLDFQMKEEMTGIIITGPNTGGKTVAIKTVGLLSLMAQSGLHIPCEEADLAMHNQVLCDIGDGQDITENLSTFSAHIHNTLAILRKVTKDSLVIMDELGSGTDPAEGMGIAVAILEELRKSGCLFLTTTHYPEVKAYAVKAERVCNARMAFDRESLKPLYKFEIGEAGESCALYIAKKLGMPGGMLRMASMAAYGTEELEYLGLSEGEERKREHTAGLRKKKEYKEKQPEAARFNMGDSVMVYPERKIGIVCVGTNDKGVLRVQMPDKKIWINHKRVKLHVKAEDLYPEDYDFSIVFDSVENRKGRHQMERKYVENLEISAEE